MFGRSQEGMLPHVRIVQATVLVVVVVVLVSGASF